jgi:predicted DNA-binding transcriptional regulator YafY
MLKRTYGVLFTWSMNFDAEENTYKALHRMLGIHEYLNKDRGPTLLSLSEKYGVSTKTIQRDIAFMKKGMNLPIEYSRELKGYRYTEEVIDMPAMKLSRQEVFALLVARSSIEQYQGSAFEDPLKSFFTKLLAHLAPLDLSNMENIHRYVSYLPNGVSTARYEDLEILGKACRDSREVEVDYRAASSGKKGKRTLRPRHLFNHGGNWYLLAASEKSKSVACYHLARMGKKIKLGQSFPPYEPFDLPTAREYAFGAFFGSGKHRVKVIFDQVAAPFVREKRWNNTQEVTEREDGGVDFEITVCDLVEIKAWVLSWGLHARATGPKRLLDEIKAELKEMKKQYA